MTVDADSDIRVKCGFPGHVKTKFLIARGGHAAVWSLLVLWTYVGRHKPDGNITGMPDGMIEAAADWAGDDGVLIEMLVDVGFLDGPPGARVLHDWDDHQSYLMGSEARSDRATIAALMKDGRMTKDQAYEIVKKKRRARRKRMVSVAQAPLPLPSPVPYPVPDPAPEYGSAGLKTPAVTNGVETWEAYSDAYERRYGKAPIRNAKVNSQVAQFCKRVPTNEAPGIAAFFLTSNNAYYVQRGHSVDCLLHDAEKLRTEWATGNQISSAQARTGDRTSGNAAVALLRERGQH